MTIAFTNKPAPPPMRTEVSGSRGLGVTVLALGFVFDLSVVGLIWAAAAGG